ncbi:MAG: hypothetical protein WKG03_01405 [Telluria sp.]
MIRVASLALVVSLTSCGGNGQSSKDFAAYRENPQTCSADSYFAKLTQSEQLHYAFGALHARPQAACIVDLLAKQDFRFLSVLQDEIERRGGIYVRYAFIDAVVIKRKRDEVSETELKELELDKFCVEVDTSSNKCHHLLKQLQSP